MKPAIGESSDDSIFNSRGTTWTADQAGSVAPDNQNDYWLIKLGSSRLLPAAFSAGGIRKFRFRLTGASELQVAQNWSDLPERYASVMKNGDSAE
ncbi:MAG: hypothetical protein HY888_11330 [Deltaproteobacteria bacterium]|nr:hypothetical protein [Deltaproteobacteria bacterium]